VSGEPARGGTQCFGCRVQALRCGARPPLLPRDLDGVFGIDANGGLGIANAAAAGLR
jgi:hypothetical protein